MKRLLYRRAVQELEPFDPEAKPEKE